MKQRMVTWGLALLLVVAQGAWLEAAAAPRRTVKGRTPTRTITRSVSSARATARTSPRVSRSVSALATRPSRSTSSLGGRARSAPTNSLGQALGSALAGRYGASGYPGSRSGSDFLSELGYRLDQAQRDSYHRSHEEREYRAYRDAMIANTVVQVVGMITSAQQPQRTCAPARPIHEVRQVVVEEGHYERYKVYIEPVHDSRTGAKIDGGYYETRTRWVPPRYEERLVLVEP